MTHEDVQDFLKLELPSKDMLVRKVIVSLGEVMDVDAYSDLGELKMSHVEVTESLVKIEFNEARFEVGIEPSAPRWETGRVIQRYLNALDQDKDPDLPLLRRVKNDSFSKEAFGDFHRVKAETEEILAKTREESSLLLPLDDQDPLDVETSEEVDIKDESPTLIKQELLDDLEDKGFEDGLDLEIGYPDEDEIFEEEDLEYEEDQDSKADPEYDPVADGVVNDLEREVKEEVMREVSEELASFPTEVS